LQIYSQNRYIGNKQTNREKAKQGDQVAFTFLDYYWNEVYGFMLKRTENETNAEDKLSKPSQSFR
jgi:hypothetical protein